MAERTVRYQAAAGGTVAVPSGPFARVGLPPIAIEAERLRRYGAFALALYYLATTRWGSYLPFGFPPFVADIGLVVLIAERAVAATMARSRPLGVDPVLGVMAAALIGWSIVLLPVGTMSPTALRDAAPYLYAVIVFLVGAPGDSRTIRAAMGRAIMLALIFHAAWITANWLDRGLWMQMPQFGKVFLFLPRPDVDGAICGMLGVIGLHRALCGRAPLLNLALGAWGCSLVFVASYSRASLLAFLAELVVLLMLSPVRARITLPSRRHWAPVTLAVLLLAIPVGIYAAKDSIAVQRLLYGKGGASGTAQGRWDSWEAIARYMEDDPVRLVRGVGYGPDFLHDSGADIELLNKTSDEVRAPHNYIMNTFARLGLVGVALIFGLLFAGVRLAVKLARAKPDLADADVLAMLCVVGMPVGATFGVILESPFGAVPYFWALGHLSAACVSLGLVRPFGSRFRPHAYEPPRGSSDVGMRSPPPAAPQLEPPPAPPPKRAPRAKIPVPVSEAVPALEYAVADPSLDLNRATFEDLRGLGLSHTQSARLIARRDAQGGFRSLSDLDQVPGFSGPVLAGLKRRVRISS